MRTTITTLDMLSQPHTEPLLSASESHRNAEHQISIRRHHDIVGSYFLHPGRGPLHEQRRVSDQRMADGLQLENVRGLYLWLNKSMTNLRLWHCKSVGGWGS